jgi:glycosyltransferase involved in cell wall biosynthesis
VAMDHAASVVSELNARGVTDVRLTVAPRKNDPMILAAMRSRLAGLAGADVEVVPLPKGEELTARLHGADLVLVPATGPGFDEAFIAAAEHGVPVLVDGRTAVGRFLTGHGGVPEHLADPTVVGRLGDTPSVRAWADRVQGALGDIGGERIRALGLREHLTSRYEPADSARGLHEALRSVGGRVARVDEAAWHRELEVVLRAGRAVEAPADGRMRVMTTCTEWRSKLGGVPTANRELTEAFGAAGAEVYGRVSTVDFEDPSRTVLEPAANVRVLGVPEVWGVLDAKGLPDSRAMIMLLDNLPPHVDVVVGHSRFSGGAATWLVDHVYPNAKYVHVLHTSPEVLDALRGKPQEGLDHAETERLLMAKADLVAGVGPLLTQEATRLNLDATRLRLEARPGDPSALVHEIISDMPANPTDPAGRPPDRVGYELTIQGRAGDAIKGVEFAARLVAELRAQGIDVRLTVRGAPDETAVRTQTRDLSAIAGNKVVVKEFTTEKAELLADLHHADLVMMPSIHEGFGLVASEAARAGVPVVVGEGTGAGMFFGDPKYLPRELGEAATVRDGVTVDMLREALRAPTAPDGTLEKAALDSAVARVNELRLAAWVEHVKSTLSDLEGQRQRALEMRGFLDHRYPLGNAGRQLLEAMAASGREEVVVHDTGMGTVVAAPQAGDVGAILRGNAAPGPAGHAVLRKPGRGDIQAGGHPPTTDGPAHHDGGGERA